MAAIGLSADETRVEIHDFGLLKNIDLTGMFTISCISKCIRTKCM
jgi:hypothetical protein